MNLYAIFELITNPLSTVIYLLSLTVVVLEHKHYPSGGDSQLNTIFLLICYFERMVDLEVPLAV
jgi:hypothetical protein